jgi:5-bromo-4-chloroindolyl phosphate hydrolysis protein
MSDASINLLLQIPLAGVVVVVVVLFLKFLERNTQQMITFMQQQADTNREFLKTQREQTNATIAGLAEEQKEMTARMAEMTGVLQSIITFVQQPHGKRNRNV